MGVCILLIPSACAHLQLLWVFIGRRLVIPVGEQKCMAKLTCAAVAGQSILVQAPADGAFWAPTQINGRLYGGGHLGLLARSVLA